MQFMLYTRLLKSNVHWFQQREELEKRMEIIKEIKALSSIKDLHVDKFDPTETKNLGLLCEMSLAEVRYLFAVCFHNKQTAGYLKYELELLFSKCTL